MIVRLSAGTNVRQKLDRRPFDALPIKYALGRIANRRNAAKTRLAKKKHSSAA
jgi:hypothetical protein